MIQPLSCHEHSLFYFYRAELDDFDFQISQNNDSGGSGDEDDHDFTDADDAIEKMLDELQEFQFVSMNF